VGNFNKEDLKEDTQEMSMVNFKFNATVNRS